MANHTDDGKPNERLVRLDDGEMHVVEDGRASAPALLLIHGTAGSTAWWDPIVPVLAETRRPGGAGVALSESSLSQALIRSVCGREGAARRRRAYGCLSGPGSGLVRRAGVQDGSRPRWTTETFLGALPGPLTPWVVRRRSRAGGTRRC